MAAIERMSYAELAARWDGVGLLVSAKPVSRLSLFRSSAKTIAAFAGLAVIAGVWWYRRAKAPAAGEAVRSSPLRPRQHLGHAVLHCGQFVAAAAVVGIGYHLLADDGLLASPSTTEAMIQARQLEFVEKLDVDGVRKAIDLKAVLIDGRFARDYQHSHLPGAISIPVDSSVEDRNKVMATIPKTNVIVIYCQSDKCQFAGTLASSLMKEGYADIALFPGGFAEWEKQAKKAVN